MPKEPKDPQFEQARAKAQSLGQQGKLDEAANLYEQLIAHDPQDLECYRELALIYERKGDIPKAINTHLRWAAICDSLGMHDEALKLYNQVLAVESAAANPEKKGLFKSASGSPEKIRELIASYRPEISLQMGRIFLQKKLADEAIKHLKGALDSSIGAQDHRVHTLLGIAYMQKNMDKEAIGEFQEVVRLAPNDAAFAYEKLGEIFLRAGKPTASTIVWFRNAGDLYLRNEQFQDAIRAYEMILSFEPRNKEVLNKLAEIYTQQGMTEQALATWRNLAHIYTDEGLLDKVIILYEKLTDVNPEDQESAARLLEIYRSILQRDPSNLSVRLKLIKHLTMRGDMQGVAPEYLALANAYLEKGVLDEAWSVLQKMLEFDARNPKAKEMLGDIHMRRDERDAALKEYLDVLKIYTDAGDEEQRLEFNQKLMSLFPEESGVQYEMARSLKEQGSYNEALSEIMKVLEQDPNHVQALSDASELMLQMGRGDEAARLYTRILSVDPNRTDIRMKLFDHYLGSNDIEAATQQVETVATALRERGLLRETEMVYRRMLHYYPDSAEMRLQICQLRLQQGDLETVLREYLMLANMYVRRALLEKAAEMYGMILQYRPDNLSAHRSLGRVLAQQGQTAQALGHYAHLAQEYLRRNLSAQALAVLHESVELAPANVDLRHRLVELLVRQMRVEEASEQYKLLIRHHLEAGQHEAAAARVKDVISLQPLHLDLRFELATMYLEFNRLEEGQALLEELVAAYEAKGQSARVLDIYDKMSSIYRAQGRHDLFWQARERAAEVYAREGRNADALGEYQEIMEGALREGNGDRARAIFPLLSNLYASESRIDDGVRAFERLVEGFARDGNSALSGLAQDFLIQMLERKGDTEQALNLLATMAVRAQESNDNELAQVLFGRVFDMLVALGQIDEAATTQFIRIKLVLAAHDVERAATLFTALWQMRPHDSTDAQRYAELLYEHEHFDQAMPLYADIVAKEPSNVEARARLAVSYARQGDMVKAAGLARGLLAGGMLDRIVGALVRAEGDGESMLRFGAFYEEMGFYEEALSHYQRAARIAQHRLDALNRTAWLFRRAGYFDLSVRQFMRTLEQPGYDDEDLLETRYNLATLYHQAGRYAEALDMFNECAAVRLRYRDVAERIAELTELIASGVTSRADVLPFAPPREEPPPQAATPAPAPHPEPAAHVEAAAPHVEAAAPYAEPHVEAAAPHAEPHVEVAAQLLGDFGHGDAPLLEGSADAPAPDLSLFSEAAAVDVMASVPQEAPGAIEEPTPPFDAGAPMISLFDAVSDSYELPSQTQIEAPPPAPQPEMAHPEAAATQAPQPATDGAAGGAPPSTASPPLLDGGDDDFFLEGPPPDPSMG